MRKSAICLLLLLAGCASTVPADAPLPERERLLLRAVVNRDIPTINLLLADDFTCEVRSEPQVSIAEPVQRFTLCTGYGHKRPASGPHDTSTDLTRTALIRSIEVREESPESATVVMEQSYFGWVPYDGGFERRSRVTDTWVRHDGQWRIARRVSEPIL